MPVIPYFNAQYIFMGFVLRRVFVFNLYTIVFIYVVNSTKKE